ncbi:MAG: hypothetical protein JSR33_02095 [Proteobacteria bacterium]|nr:hypothetical protein [Pseudomonadota bacterium]
MKSLWKSVVDYINVNAGDSILIQIFNNEVLHKAVLIDGGEPSEGESRVLPFLIKKQTINKSFKLNALVVTHYDSDHLGGIVRLLKNTNFCTNFLAAPDLSDPQTPKPNFCIYDPGAYVAGKNQLATRIFKQYMALVNQLVEDKKALHATVFEKADKSLLGHEFLENKSINLESGFVATCSALRKIDPYQNNQPMLLCVAVNTSVAKLQSTTNIVVTPEGTVDPTTEKNQRSIGLILISSTNEILHYLMGDLGESIEVQLLPWLQKSPTESSPIKYLKFSHHGSRYSTPISLIEQCKPKYGIISAGNQHGHPTLELMLYLADYNLNNMPNRSKKRKPADLNKLQIFATNYPYWLGSDTDSDAKKAWAGITKNFDGVKLKTLSKTSEIKRACDNPQNITMVNYWAYISGINMNGGEYYPKSSGQSPFVETITITDSDTDCEVQAGGAVYHNKEQKIEIPLSSIPLIRGIQTPYVFGLSSEIKNGPKIDYFVKDDSQFYFFLKTLRFPYLTVLQDQDSQPGKGQVTGWLSNTVVDDEIDFLASWLKIPDIDDMYVKVRYKDDPGGEDDITVEFSTNLQIKDAETKIPLTATMIFPPRLTPTPLHFTSSKTLLSLNSLLKLGGYTTIADLVSLLTDLFNFSTDTFPVELSLDFISKNGSDYRAGSNYISTIHSEISLLTTEKSIGGILKLKEGQLFLTNLLIPDQISDEGVVYSFVQQSSMNISANATINLDQTSAPLKVEVDITLQSNGWLQVGLILELDHLIPFLNALTKTMDLGNRFTSFIETLDLQVDSKASVAVIVIFTNKLEFSSIQFNTKMKIGNMILDINCLLPRGKLWGGLAVQKEEKYREIEIRDSKSSDRAMPGRNEDGKISFKNFLDAKGVTSPDASINDFNIADLYFSADITDKAYVLGGTIDTSTWYFSEMIQLTSLSAELGYSKNNSEAATLRAQMAMMLQSGDINALLYGEYISNQGWVLATKISLIPVTSLFNLIPNAKYLTDLLPDISVKEIDLKLCSGVSPSNQKFFSFTGTFQFGGDILADTHFFLFSFSNPTKYLFSVSITPPQKLTGVPLVKELPSLISRLLFIAVVGEVSEDNFSQGESFGCEFDFIVKSLIRGKKLPVGVSLLIFVTGMEDDPIIVPIRQTPVPPSEFKSCLLASVDDQPAVSVNWINVQRTFGPLTLQRIGFGYHNNRVLIKLDAGLQLGILAFKLQGFGVGFPLSDCTQLSFTLDGLNVDYKASSSLAFSGGFLRDPAPPPLIKESYSGNVMLQIKSINLSAIGSYSKDQQDDVSVFIFARLKAPLGGPPCFFVTGLAGGFGYNQRLNLPSQEQVTEFPLVQGSAKPEELADDPQTVLTKLLKSGPDKTTWLQLETGQYWLAMGLNFTTFNVVETNALAVVEFGRDFQFALLGRSCFKLPKSSIIASPLLATPLVSAEIGFELILNPDKGILLMTALLNSSSYVLHPDCRLTGSFALYAWFKDQIPPDSKEPQKYARAGDFVITMGGYHPAFIAPAWYPREPRLALRWKSGPVTVDSEAYFALTPSCVMTGGLLQAEFKDGDLQAWIKTNADFLVQWHPLSYDAEMNIRIGASYRLKTLLTTSTLTAEIASKLNLFGPPLGGSIDIDWYMISFRLTFGSEKLDRPPQTWQEFRSFLFADKPSASPPGKRTINTIRVERGLLSEVKAESSQSSEWVVRADEVILTTESLIPITELTVNDSGNLIVNDPEENVYIKPMVQQITAHKHSITIKIDDSRVSNSPAPTSDVWQTELINRRMPVALWGQSPDSKSSPVLSSDILTQDSFLAGEKCVGVKITPVPPTSLSTLGLFNVKKALDIKPLKDVLLPLEQKPSSLAPSIQAPDLKTDSRDVIKKEITAKYDSRNQMITSLQKMGFFSGMPEGFKSSEMRELGIEAGNFLEEPRLENPLGSK